MGREAHCTCRWEGGSGEVKVLLEARELIIRGSLRRVFPLLKLTAVKIEGDDLVVTAGTETVALKLGADAATQWSRKISTPAPTLAEKLGISATAPVLVLSKEDDPALTEALRGATVREPDDARICIACVTGEQELAEAVARADQLAPGRPLWVVNRKGARSVFGETAVRLAMRNAGFMDNKVASVSPSWSATRYARKRNS